MAEPNPTEAPALVSKLLAAASTVTDLDVRAAYLASARGLILVLRAELALATSSLEAQEREIARARGAAKGT